MGALRECNLCCKSTVFTFSDRDAAGRAFPGIAGGAGKADARDVGDARPSSIGVLQNSQDVGHGLDAQQSERAIDTGTDGATGAAADRECGEATREVDDGNDGSNDGQGHSDRPNYAVDGVSVPQGLEMRREQVGFASDLGQVDGGRHRGPCSDGGGRGGHPGDVPQTRELVSGPEDRGGIEEAGPRRPVHAVAFTKSGMRTLGPVPGRGAARAPEGASRATAATSAGGGPRAGSEAGRAGASGGQALGRVLGLTGGTGQHGKKKKPGAAQAKPSGALMDLGDLMSLAQGADAACTCATLVCFVPRRAHPFLPRPFCRAVGKNVHKGGPPSKKAKRG